MRCAKGQSVVGWLGWARVSRGACVCVVFEAFSAVWLCQLSFMEGEGEVGQAAYLFGDLARVLLSGGVKRLKGGLPRSKAVFLGGGLGCLHSAPHPGCDSRAP